MASSLAVKEATRKIYKFGHYVIKTIWIVIQRKPSCRQRIPQSSSARKETADIDIFITFKNGDKKLMPPIKIARGSPTQIRK